MSHKLCEGNKKKKKTVPCPERRSCCNFGFTEFFREVLLYFHIYCELKF